MISGVGYNYRFVPLVRYAWTTVLGILPLTVLVAYLGSRLESPNFSDWRVWVAIAAFVGIVVIGQVAERKLRSGGAKRGESG